MADDTLPPWFTVLRQDLKKQALDARDDLNQLRDDLTGQIKQLVTQNEFEAEKTRRDEQHAQLQRIVADERIARQAAIHAETEARKEQMELERTVRRDDVKAERVAREDLERKLQEREASAVTRRRWLVGAAIAGAGVLTSLALVIISYVGSLHA